MLCRVRAYYAKSLTSLLLRESVTLLGGLIGFRAMYKSIISDRPKLHFSIQSINNPRSERTTQLVPTRQCL